MYFDGAANMHGNGVGAIIVSPEGKQFPVAIKLEFDYTNNIAEYKACVNVLRAAITLGIRCLKVFGDSVRIIHQVIGEWRTKDAKLIPYQELLTNLIKQFEVVSFHHLTRDKNCFTDALATLAAIIQLDYGVHVQPIQVEARSFPAYCLNVKEDQEEYPWFQDIKDYITKRSYPTGMTENEKKTLRCLAMTFFVKMFYTRGVMMVPYFAVCGYFWLTIEKDCFEHIKKCHKCQIYANRINAPPIPLHNLVSPWPFSMWGIDIIDPINLKALNGHRFILVAIDYFTKWVEANSFASITQKTFLKFMKTNILCRYGIPKRIITDNGPNLNGTEVKNFYEKFQIKNHNSAPYRPQMNGAVEATNKNIKKIIGKMTVTYKDGHEMLPYALHGYRTTARTSIGVTPDSLVYGMETVTPIEMEIPS
ncbi:uncharacterized protein LOC129305422 [Prosopis cineraria]|uniref:uncharacterized protein LOC129305422 n=1 Tax=Prosopis cineraria TaxID=364024 RepID=UPI00240F7737|nr:uncharacterized protein LOC129305422 [Prosopis cineraria]